VKEKSCDFSVVKKIRAYSPSLAENSLGSSLGVASIPEDSRFDMAFGIAQLCFQGCGEGAQAILGGTKSTTWKTIGPSYPDHPCDHTHHYSSP